jgi:divalent metal cation (Fe/Co/Zn/Cd) transporter
VRIVGGCFLALTAYTTYESAMDLWAKKAPEHSIPGIILACISLIVMPLLSRAKRKVGRALDSAAMHADAKQTEFCMHLSAILLAGLLLNTLFGVLQPSWFPSSRKKESKDCKAKPARKAAREIIEG